MTEVRGFGRQKGHREIYRGAEYQIAYVPKIKLEVAVPADVAERVVETIRTSARTGNIGDGKIFVLPLELAMRVRTGETGAGGVVGLAPALGPPVANKVGSPHEGEGLCTREG